MQAPNPPAVTKALTPQTAMADEGWTLVIQPHGSLLDLKLKELWQYRDLIVIFVRRDFVAQYKQTILGPAWHFFAPLLTTVVFTIVFGQIAKMPTDGVPPFLFYMAGNIVWGYFSAVLLGTSGTFTNNAGIFSKVYFPRLAVPVASLISRLIAFAIQLLFFLCFLSWFMLQGANVKPNAWVLAMPLMLVLLAALGLGLGVIASSLTTKYRDLTVLIGFGVQLFMYATPVIYPLSAVPSEWRTWAALNPVAPVMEWFRFAFLGVGHFEPQQLATASAITAIILLVGVILFNRVERTFIDTV
jgi:lipopolysaccharide transport system permease protein